MDTQENNIQNLDAFIKKFIEFAEIKGINIVMSHGDMIEEFARIYAILNRDLYKLNSPCKNIREKILDNPLLSQKEKSSLSADLDRITDFALELACHSGFIQISDYLLGLLDRYVNVKAENDG